MMKFSSSESLLSFDILRFLVRYSIFSRVVDHALSQSKPPQLSKQDPV